MTERIRKLREKSLNAINRLSAERGLLVTEFYKGHSATHDTVPVQRAKSFEFILQHKTICINDGELIVGERGPAPKATPTYPEINLHSLKDLDVLDSREKVFFKVDLETRRAFEEVIIPYWIGKTNRERIFENLSSGWKDAYEADMFTEFQEQRAPGHTVLGSKIYRLGMQDIITEIQGSLKNLDFMNDPEAYHKSEELRAMEITASALIMFANRHADKLIEFSSVESDPLRKEELARMAGVCRNVPAKAPCNINEALQYYWFVHLGVITELNPWDSFNPGRLDQHLYPFYLKDLESGLLDKETAKELLQSFWIKFNNHPSPPKVGITAQESNTYTDFCLINVGGLKEDGSNAVNELNFVLLDVIEEMRLLQPSSMVQVSKKNPDNFVDRAVNGRKSPRGATYRINMLPTTSHVYFGKVVGATTDGRLAHEPLSEGISPFQGMDRKGPTAMLNSALKIDHLKTGGTLLNQKFTPEFFKNESSIRKITQLIRGYFKMDGHHIQFNVVSADTLRDAQKHPEKYQDLIVRVAGYSDYFNDLGSELQEEIIRRTAHERV